MGIVLVLACIAEDYEVSNSLLDVSDERQMQIGVTITHHMFRRSRDGQFNVSIIDVTPEQTRTHIHSKFFQCVIQGCTANNSLQRFW
jgi:hypothetical protein